MGNMNDSNQEMKFTGEHVSWKTVLEGRIQGGSISNVQFEVNCFKLVLMFLDCDPPSKAPLLGSWVNLTM